MLFLRKPRDTDVREFLREQQGLPFSYPALGMTRGPAPAGFNVDHNRVRLGAGPGSFAGAKRALQQWRMFDLDWVELLWPDTPIEVGAVVAVAVHQFGLWSLSACRIVYVVDEDGCVEKYGFA